MGYKGGMVDSLLEEHCKSISKHGFIIHCAWCKAETRKYALWENSLCVDCQIKAIEMVNNGE